MATEKKSILIVDDSELNRALLSDMLYDDFNIIEAENGMEAIAILKERELEISLMLLDIVMPQMDGFDVLAMMNNKGWINNIPVIMISAETGSAYIDRAYDLGAVDYISRPFDERTVKHRVMSNFMLALKQREMSDLLVEQIYQRERDNKIMIEILSHIVEFRNGESGLHILHVSTFTEMILKHLVLITDRYKLSQADIKMIVNASALHDVGKMSVPDEILNKPGRFTPEEFEIMKRHTVEGEKMLAAIPARRNEPIVKVSAEICRWHHERWDGRGYPDGLKGDAIPISAQVVALADVYDALTSKRCYKDGFPHEKAIEMIQNGECGAFNPLILQCLGDLQAELKEALHNNSPTETFDSGARDNVEHMLKASGSDVSNRTIQLLEHERMKFRFFASLSREVMFEYVASPEMIVLTDFSAEYLELPEKIPNPAESDFASRVFNKDDFNHLMTKIKASTPESPIVEGKYLMTIRGEQKWNKVIVQALWSDTENPVLEGALGKCLDITEETEELQQLENLADKDQITNLLNARAAKHKISNLLAAPNDYLYAMVFFDLDNLKRANDDYGHLFGNKLIKTIADRMIANTRTSDICARFGGDEFVIFMRYKDEHQIDRIFHALTEEDLDGFPVRVSMGIALSNECDGDYDTLLHMADQAAYAVKKTTKNAYKFYNALTEAEKKLTQ
ncbi:MAG: diguanylate cyclase [Clostridiales bacterium]|nr:diguanylate cyclase [Clostridiales bacterium]